jgi:hypothetical protein
LSVSNGGGGLPRKRAVAEAEEPHEATRSTAEDVAVGGCWRGVKAAGNRECKHARWVKRKAGIAET